MNKKQKNTIYVGLAIIAAAIVIWIVFGCEIFTKTQVLVEKKDELFGNTYKEWQDKFIWGLDLTGAITAAVTIVCTILFFIFKRKKVL